MTTDLFFDVAGGRLHALRLGTGPRTALAVHGISASAMAWSAVGAALPEDWSLVALDLRGRGASRDLPGPFGLAAHAADVNAVAAALAEENGGPVPLVGHSMGAYVAVLAVDDRPDLYARVVLVDGGVPLPVPDGVDPDDLLAATLGPALERLRTTYASVDAYLDFYRRHPALGPFWDDTIDAYVRYDVLETPEGVRSRAVDAAVRADGRDLLLSGPALDAALRATTRPTALLVAPAGMFGQEPGLLPAEAVAGYDAAVPALSVETVPDTNHYTVLFQEVAARRVAAAVTATPR
jgi:pimeloyl-ACP methyl ester carboxylesterase